MLSRLLKKSRRQKEKEEKRNKILGGGGAMLTEICAEIRNYFTYNSDKHFGDFAIVNGAIAPSLSISTDYIRIVGSHKNDGVHKRGTDGKFALVDEDSFHGAVWVMSPPADFIALVAEIEAWQAKNGGVDSQAMSPYNSESFGGYSYSKSGGSGGSSSGAADWAGTYARRLNIYRKIRVN